MNSRSNSAGRKGRERQNDGVNSVGGGVDKIADSARERKWGVGRRLQQGIESQEGEFSRELGG